MHAALAFADPLSDIGLFVTDKSVPDTAWRAGVMGSHPTITGVEHGSGAQQAGLQSGDVILSVGGKTVEKTADLRAMQQILLPVVVLRGMRRMTLGEGVAVLPEITTSPKIVSGQNSPLAERSSSNDLIETGAPVVFPQTGHVGSLVGSLLYTPDGKKLLSMAYNYLVLWDASSLREIRKFLGHTHPIMSMAITTDGNYAISGSGFGELILWNMQNGSVIKKIDGLSGNVDAVSFSNDNKYVFASLNKEEILSKVKSEYKVKIFDSSNLNEIGTLNGLTGIIRSISFNNDGSELLIHSFDSVRILNYKSMKEQVVIRDSDGEIRSAIYINDGNSILTVTEIPAKLFSNEEYKSLIKQWNAKNGKFVRLIAHSTSTSVEVSKDNKYILANNLEVHDFLTGKIVKKLIETTPPVTNSYVAVYSPDGKSIISGHAFGIIKLWDIATAKEVIHNKSYVVKVGAIGYSPDAKSLISGNRVFDTKTLAEKCKLAGHADRINSAVFSSDSTRILTGSDDNTLKLWDSSSCRLISTLAGHTDPVKYVTIFQNNRYAASGSTNFLKSISSYGQNRDDSVRLWDLTSGKEIIKLLGGDIKIDALALSYNNDFIYAAISEHYNNQLVHKIIKWDIKNAKKVRDFDRLTSKITSIEIRQNNQNLHRTHKSDHLC
jgi:WD40 repeat protein